MEIRTDTEQEEAVSASGQWANKRGYSRKPEIAELDMAFRIEEKILCGEEGNDQHYFALCSYFQKQRPTSGLISRWINPCRWQLSIAKIICGCGVIFEERKII
jgi:hypothetical protein